MVPAVSSRPATHLVDCEVSGDGRHQWFRSRLTQVAATALSPHWKKRYNTYIENCESTQAGTQEEEVGLTTTAPTPTVGEEAPTTPSEEKEAASTTPEEESPETTQAAAVGDAALVQDTTQTLKTVYSVPSAASESNSEEDSEESFLGELESIILSIRLLGKMSEKLAGCWRSVKCFFEGIFGYDCSK